MPQNRRFAWLSNSIIKKKKRNSPHSTNAPTFTKSYKITNYYFNNYAELILLKNLNSNEEFLQTRLFPTNANNSQVNNCSNLNLRERIGPHLVGCQNHKIRGLVFLLCSNCSPSSMAPRTFLAPPWFNVPKEKSRNAPFQLLILSFCSWK